MRKVLIKNYIKAVFMGADGTEHSSQNYANSFTKVEGTGQWSDYETSGHLIAWGIEAEEGSSYTVGIIELPDGTITTRLPDHIKFELPTEVSGSLHMAELLDKIAPFNEYLPENQHGIQKLGPSIRGGFNTYQANTGQ